MQGLASRRMRLVGDGSIPVGALRIESHSLINTSDAARADQLTAARAFATLATRFVCFDYCFLRMEMRSPGNFRITSYNADDVSLFIGSIGLAEACFLALWAVLAELMRSSRCLFESR